MTDNQFIVVFTSVWFISWFIGGIAGLSIAKYIVSKLWDR